MRYKSFVLFTLFTLSMLLTSCGGVLILDGSATPVFPTTLAPKVTSTSLPTEKTTLTPTFSPSVEVRPTLSSSATASATSSETPTLPVISTVTPCQVHGTITTGYTWLRTGPGENYLASEKYEGDKDVSILGKNQDEKWLYVSLAGGRQGWVSSSSIQMDTLVCELPNPTAPPTQTPLPTLPPGTKIKDPCFMANRLYQRIMRAYDTKQGDGGYDSGADLNGDGQITIVDVGLMIDRWPKNCPKPS